jgi:hypothetical protein
MAFLPVVRDGRIEIGAILRPPRAITFPNSAPGGREAITKPCGRDLSIEKCRMPPTPIGGIQRLALLRGGSQWRS